MLIPYWQRLLASFIYILPFSDVLNFGTDLFIQFPILELLIIPTIPFIFIKQNILFGSVLIFIILFFAVVNNNNVPYFLRFNTLQSILINIGIVITSYGFELILKPIGNVLLIKAASASTFIVILSIMIFSITKCLQGEEADIPGISESVRIQI